MCGHEQPCIEDVGMCSQDCTGTREEPHASSYHRGLFLVSELLERLKRPTPPPLGPPKWKETGQLRGTARCVAQHTLLWANESDNLDKAMYLDPGSSRLTPPLSLPSEGFSGHFRPHLMSL